MRARMPTDVRHRPDDFGGVAYVGSRDDFFVLDGPTYKALCSFTPAWTSVPDSSRPPISALAAMQLLETEDPRSQPRAYSGPFFIGDFRDIVTLSEPLVLNCFSTSHCPLKCQYCHADDLMSPAARAAEDRGGQSALSNVVATARLVNSLVAVITGGDPLTRPARTTHLIEALRQHKALVLDTSGVAQPHVIRELVPVLVRHGVHVRVSLDSHRRDVQEELRPLNRQYESALSSYDAALYTIDACLESGIPVTVQTVISNRNDRAEDLAQLRDFLLARQVRHWVLHLAVEAGAARVVQRRAKRGAKGKAARGGILPKGDARTEVWRVTRDTIDQGLLIDMRVTDNANTPNSVLLLGADGVLYTEGLAHHGKVVLFNPETDSPDQVRRLFYYIDKFGHARRYLNWNPDMFDGKNLAELCVPGIPPAARPLTSIVELEQKYRIRDRDAVVRSLSDNGYRLTSASTVDDRYFDTADRSLDLNDFVVRVRVVDGQCRLAQKGPRFRRANGEYGRIELEVPLPDPALIEEHLGKRGLVITWQFARQRSTFVAAKGMPEVVIDDLPTIGSFLEIEGASDQISAVARVLGGLDAVETRNYMEIVRAWCYENGKDWSTVYGLGDTGVLVKRT